MLTAEMAFGGADVAFDLLVATALPAHPSTHIGSHPCVEPVSCRRWLADDEARRCAAALATGWAYYRTGPRVLIALPVLSFAIPILGFWVAA
jgi:hypothetical protein